MSLIHLICRQVWHDELIGWDPEEYGGIRDIRLPPDQVWTPDIMLYNRLENTMKLNK